MRVEVVFFLPRLLIGAICSASLSLSGNRGDPALNSEGKASQTHVKVFTADAVLNHPAVRLTRGGMVLIALLSGGDYDHVCFSNIIAYMPAEIVCY